MGEVSERNATAIQRAIEQLADEVAESNMNDGVAHIIEDALQRAGKQ